MSISFTPGATLQTDAGSFSMGSTAIVGSGSVHLSETAAANDDTVMVIAVDVSAVKAFAIKSTKDVIITVNDDGSPTATITLTANKAVIWVAGDAQYPSSNPLGLTDVASWSVANAGSADALITFGCLVDATP